MKQLHIPSGKHVYCISDMHLGFPDAQASRERERILVAWLTSIRSDVSDLFLLGDVFDFWFEYKEVVPKGFVRFIGALAQLADQGVRLHIFVGNHDLWMRDYFEGELGATIYYEPTEFEFQFESTQHRLCMGHGDGMGPGDYGYKLLKKVFVNPIAQFLFGWLHPDLGVRLANAWSGTRKTSTIKAGEVPFDPATDYILAAVRDRYVEDQRENRGILAYVFGHRHHPIALELGEGASYYNLGDWFSPNFKNAYVLKIEEKGLDFVHFQYKS
jgi:UDP-2,3-diacylglucosamine hydrolase